MTFGENLKKLRNDNGMTQEQLAEKIFVTRMAISKWAFYACNSLTSIIIPDSITEIGDYAFLLCDRLEVNYMETEAQWNAISKNNNSFSNVTINYNSSR